MDIIKTPADDDEISGRDNHHGLAATAEGCKGIVFVLGRGASGKIRTNTRNGWAQDLLP